MGFSSIKYFSLAALAALLVVTASCQLDGTTGELALSRQSRDTGNVEREAKLTAVSKVGAAGLDLKSLTYGKLKALLNGPGEIGSPTLDNSTQLVWSDVGVKADFPVTGDLSNEDSKLVPDDVKPEAVEVDRPSGDLPAFKGSLNGISLDDNVKKVGEETFPGGYMREMAGGVTVFTHAESGRIDKIVARFSQTSPER